MKLVKFGPVWCRGLTREIIFAQDEHLKIIVSVNAEAVVLAAEDQKFRMIINENYGTFDGQITFQIAKTMNRGIRIEKLSGSDVIYEVCEQARKDNRKVFLLGGYEESNRIAVERLRKEYHEEIYGLSPEPREYPFDQVHNEKIMTVVSRLRPEFLLVGFGTPKQEYWIADYREELEKCGVQWVMGVGGSFEFVSGLKKRAPVVIQNIGMEWLWRLCLEPRKRLKRIVMALRLFQVLSRQYVEGTLSGESV